MLNQIINMPKGNRKPFYLGGGFIAPAFYFSKGYSLCGHYTIKSFAEVINLCYLQTKFG